LNYSSIQKQKKTDNIQAATYELKRNRQDLHKQAAAAAQSHLMHNKQVVDFERAKCIGTNVYLSSYL